MTRAWPALSGLMRWVEAERFSGYDPYDALNSPVLRTLSLGTKWGRIACIQAMKRSPVNMRPILLVPRGHNPKGLGLFLSGYSRLYAMDKRPEHLDRMRFLLDRLRELRSSGCTGNAWGYDFPWQSRSFYAERFSPNIIASSFIGHGLLDAHESAALDGALELAVPIADFILRDLPRLSEGGGFCFGYVPSPPSHVHNANLMGASLLIRLFAHTGDAGQRDAALGALKYTLSHQLPDGAWYYGQEKYRQWIDSFHTGFNLHALRRFMDAGYDDICRESYDRGVRYYADNFFLPDGTPKYYHNKVEPLDIHCPAEAVAFFSAMGEEYQGLTGRVLGWMLGNMHDPRGFFYFQRRGGRAIRIPYMRWSQAWAFYALCEYVYNTGEMRGADG